MKMQCMVVTLSRFIQRLLTNYFKLKIATIHRVSLVLILQTMLLYNLVRHYYDVWSTMYDVFAMTGRVVVTRVRVWAIKKRMR